MHDVEEIIWTDGPSSEWKNKYVWSIIKTCCTFQQDVLHMEVFSLSIFPLLTVLVDGVGGNCKSVVPCKTMTKGIYCIIMQNAKECTEATACLVTTINVIYIP